MTNSVPKIVTKKSIWLDLKSLFGLLFFVSVVGIVVLIITDTDAKLPNKLNLWFNKIRQNPLEATLITSGICLVGWILTPGDAGEIALTEVTSTKLAVLENSKNLNTLQASNKKIIDILEEQKFKLQKNFDLIESKQAPAVLETEEVDDNPVNVNNTTLTLLLDSQKQLQEQIKLMSRNFELLSENTALRMNKNL
ncbi:hypothetical protein HC864_05615 [Candidatus Gracilibacteria bacterium]|nr:hypothetical protein [Candidatus Gracilibacteria bacterium]